MNKTLFLLRGLPGSGKTTTANLLSENGKYPVLSADQFFEDQEGNYHWDASKIKKAHAWCKERVVVYMSGSDSPFWMSTKDKIFVTNTFTQEWEMNDYFALAARYDYQVVTLVVENRHGSTNIHNVPDETIEKMRNRFEVKL